MAEFRDLYAINVNDRTEKKNGLTYLSWAWAWAEFKKAYPDATYTIEKFNGLPYVFDDDTGYMVYTTVTAGGLTHEMWLPVMDGANKAMKNDVYEYYVKNPNFKYAQKQDDGKYRDKYGKEQPEYLRRHVEPATMFDVNKTIMRCLVKNLAMFGLGLYIYAGEDLPEEQQQESAQKPQENAQNTQESAQKPQESVHNDQNMPTIPGFEPVLKNDGDLTIGGESISRLITRCAEDGVHPQKLCDLYGVGQIKDLSSRQFAQICRVWSSVIRKECAA